MSEPNEAAGLTCSRLEQKEKCIVVRKYRNGQFDELLHEHVPAKHLNKSDSDELLTALVLHYANVEGRYILQCYLNSRAHEPYLRGGIEYPEPGVHRRFMRDSTITAWVDEVFIPIKLIEP